MNSSQGRSAAQLVSELADVRRTPMGAIARDAGRATQIRRVLPGSGAGRVAVAAFTSFI